MYKINSSQPNCRPNYENTSLFTVATTSRLVRWIRHVCGGMNR